MSSIATGEALADKVFDGPLEVMMTVLSGTRLGQVLSRTTSLLLGVGTSVRPRTTDRLLLMPHPLLESMQRVEPHGAYVLDSSGVTVFAPEAQHLVDRGLVGPFLDAALPPAAAGPGVGTDAEGDVLMLDGGSVVAPSSALDESMSSGSSPGAAGGAAAVPPPPPMAAPTLAAARPLAAVPSPSPPAPAPGDGPRAGAAREGLLLALAHLDFYNWGSFALPFASWTHTSQLRVMCASGGYARLRVEAPLDGGSADPRVARAMVYLPHLAAEVTGFRRSQASVLTRIADLHSYIVRTPEFGLVLDAQGVHKDLDAAVKELEGLVAELFKAQTLLRLEVSRLHVVSAFGKALSTADAKKRGRQALAEALANGIAGNYKMLEQRLQFVPKTPVLAFMRMLVDGHAAMAYAALGVLRSTSNSGEQLDAMTALGTVLAWLPAAVTGRGLLSDARFILPRLACALNRPLLDRLKPVLRVALHIDDEQSMMALSAEAAAAENSAAAADQTAIPAASARPQLAAAPPPAPDDKPALSPPTAEQILVCSLCRRAMGDLRLPTSRDKLHQHLVDDHPGQKSAGRMVASDPLYLQKISDTLRAKGLSTELVGGFLQMFSGARQGLFITGGAGSGKTYATRALIEVMNEAYGDGGVLVCCTTGMAAGVLDESARTLHSALGLGRDASRSAKDVAATLRSNPAKCKEIRRSHCLVIDEISMGDKKALDLACAVLREVCGVADKAFAGKQVIIVGKYRALALGCAL